MKFSIYIDLHYAREGNLLYRHGRSSGKHRNALLPFTVIRKVHFADSPSCVVAKYVITCTPALKECPGTFDLKICFMDCLLSNDGSLHSIERDVS